MKATDSTLPCSFPFAADTGAVSQATAHYEKRLSALRGLYLDSEALEWRIREENDPVATFAGAPPAVFSKKTGFSERSRLSSDKINNGFTQAHDEFANREGAGIVP